MRCNEPSQQLLEEHRDRIYSHALYCLRDPEDAEDVTQEAFLAVAQRRGRSSPTRSAAWLIAGGPQPLHRPDPAPQVPAHPFRAAGPRSRWTGLPAGRRPDDPEADLQLDQRQTGLLDAMATLPAETRSVMMMHYFQGLKLQEIAESWTRPSAPLKVQIHRARKPAPGPGRPAGNAAWRQEGRRDDEALPTEHRSHRTAGRLRGRRTGCGRRRAVVRPPGRCADCRAELAREMDLRRTLRTCRWSRCPDAGHGRIMAAGSRSPGRSPAAPAARAGAWPHLGWSPRPLAAWSCSCRAAPGSRTGRRPGIHAAEIAAARQDVSYDPGPDRRSSTAPNGHRGRRFRPTACPTPSPVRSRQSSNTPEGGQG